MAPEARGTKHVAGKLRWDLLPLVAVQEGVKVLTFGAHAYGPNDWRSVRGWRWKYLRAAISHLFKYALGERFDDETGLHHLAHLWCCVSFLLEFELTGAPHGDDGAADKIELPPYVAEHRARAAPPAPEDEVLCAHGPCLCPAGSQPDGGRRYCSRACAACDTSSPPLGATCAGLCAGDHHEGGGR